MSLISLALAKIQDFDVRENFKKIQDFINKQSILNDFQFFDVTFSIAETNKKITHTLGAIPLDVIQTRKTGAGNITFNYESFSREELDVTVSGPCRVRFLVGASDRAAVVE